MNVSIEVTPEEMLDLLQAIYVEKHAYPGPAADIPDLVRSAFLTGLRMWADEPKG